MKNKINLEEIIEKYRLDTDHYADQDFTESAIEKICLEFGAKLLELAAENSMIEEVHGEKLIRKDFSFYDNHDGKLGVNKQSIIDTIKQVE